MATSLHKQRPPIRRNRTGCFTCRRRKKKCDELKPQCYNCIRNNFVCSGYPTLATYEELRDLQSSRVDEDHTTQQDTSTASNLFDENLDFLFEGNEFLLRNLEEDEIAQASGLDLDSIYNCSSPLDTDQTALVLQKKVTDSTTAVPKQQQNYLISTANKQQHPPIASASKPIEIRPKSFLNELPFLFNNINTSVEHQLFLHFTKLTSRVLTLSNGKNNPLTSIVVPLASRDKMVMQSLLSLAGSHLVSISPYESLQSTNAEKHRLHDIATRAQALRIQALEGSRHRQSPQELEAILTSALLLCLYEICEGSGDATWRFHLETARKLISWSMPKESNKAEGTTRVDSVSSALAGINRFFLEFFIYHDTLAAVTVSSSSPLLSSGDFQLESSGYEDAYVVGVNDGLCDLITRIADLRSHAATVSPDQKGDIYCEAVVVWDDLANWKPNSEDAEQRLIGSLYQWALFIWLYCIVHPDGIADEKLQSAVSCAIQDLKQIQTSSGVLACLLFPLFIIGTTSIDEKDRSIVKSHFQSLRAWSGLGNVKIAQGIVERSWTSYDDAVPRSWDWMAQMESRGISVPIT